MKTPPTSIGQNIGLSRNNSPNTAANPAKTVSRIAPILWTMLPVRIRSRSSPIAIASAAQTCRADFGEAGGIAIDVAAVDGMADFHERQQHREQDRGRIPPRAAARRRRARRRKMACRPERQRRNAVTPQQPVEDRRGADGVADDARLVADAQHHDAGEDGGERAQERNRPLHRNPGRCPVDISASAIVSQPFSSAKVSASASAPSVPVANSATEIGRPGRLSRLVRISVAPPKAAAKQHRQDRKRDRAIEMRDAGIERDQQRQRREHGGGRPHHRDDGAGRAALRQKSRDAKSGGEDRRRRSDAAKPSRRWRQGRCPATGRPAAPACPDCRAPPIRRTP